MLKRYNNNMSKKLVRSGAVSMLTVIMLSIFLSLITTGFVRLMVSYQRESTNSDLSMRAYYAAQSGFEDAERLINAGHISASQNTCPPVKPDQPAQHDSSGISVANSDSKIDAAYTCELISFPESSNVQSFDNVGVNQAVVFPVTPKNVPTSGKLTLTVKWTPGDNPRQASGKSLPDVNYWQSAGGGAPAMMRANVVWANSSDVNLNSQAYFLNPSSGNNKNPIDSGDDEATVNLNGSGGLPKSDDPSAHVDPIKNVQCQGSGDTVQCSGDINLSNVSTSSTIFLVLRPIYANVDSVSVTSTHTGTVANYKSGQVSIDITGKAGNVYRRIKQSIPYGKFAATKLSSKNVSDFALVAGDGICKQISIGTTSASYANGCI